MRVVQVFYCRGTYRQPIGTLLAVQKWRDGEIVFVSDYRSSNGRMISELGKLWLEVVKVKLYLCLTD
jgi:hypothetical protein